MISLLAELAISIATKKKVRLLRSVLLIAIPAALFIVLFNFVDTEVCVRSGAPSLLFVGDKIRPQPHLFSPLDPGKINRLREQTSVAPFVYRNLLDIYDLSMHTRFQFSALMASTQDIATHLTPFLGSGVVPSGEKNECLIGDLAARYWKLKVGDDFVLNGYLVQKVPDHAPAKDRFTVSGILSKEIRLNFLRGAIVAAGKDGSLSEANGMLVFEPRGGKFINAFKESAFREKLNLYFERTPFMESGGATFALLATIGWLFISLIASSTACITESFGDFSILKALGMSNRSLWAVMGFTLALAQGLGIGLGVILGNLATELLNREIAKNPQFDFPFQYYLLNSEPGLICLLISLVACLLGACILINKARRPSFYNLFLETTK